MRIWFVRPKQLQDPLTLFRVDKHRRFNCVFYGLCLDYACTFNYSSFSCTECKDFVEDPEEFVTNEEREIKETIRTNKIKLRIRRRICADSKKARCPKCNRISAEIFKIFKGTFMDIKFTANYYECSKCGYRFPKKINKL